MLAGDVAIGYGFHSISFPSEWGDNNFTLLQPPLPLLVSIQLVSPASGEILDEYLPDLDLSQVSIQLVSPASGENRSQFIREAVEAYSFHSISFPSEWGGSIALARVEGIKFLKFPFN